MFEPLYNPKTIEEEIQKETISQEQKTRANEWLKLINDGTLENEETNYIRFQNILLRDILNFPEKEIEKGFEKKDVEYSFADDEKTFVCIEAKGTKTKNLFARQARIKKDQETPVIQTITNMSRFPSEYGICTNYNNFILITKEHGQQKCHKFSFDEIKNNDDRLKEFILIFSYDNLKKRSANKDELHDKSVTQNEKFTEEFYDVFHETRLMLIKAFEEKQGVDRKSAIKYSQIILNRLLFIFFTSDKTNISVPKDLFTNQITKLLKSGICSDNSQHIYNEILNLFVSFEKGSTSLGIFGFNGGLFAEKIPSEIYFYDLKNPDFFKDVKSKSIKISVNSKIQQILDANKGMVSPIIVNFLIMDAYDFEKEVDVRILGHVLEQSVSDIEVLHGKRTSRRKKEGIYYTPEFITDYICRETILPYLSEKNSTTIHQLVTEYSENLNDLENKFKSIKIIDPACGSGAFLIKAAEVLLEIYHAIQEERKLQGGYTAEVKRRKRSSTQKLATLDEQIDKARMNKIIENNIFGVDLSEESVGITKLSLFLKLSIVEKKLSDLSQNIKVGNSLVEDRLVDVNAFHWKKEFPKIFENGGFDIVVGNPPYLRVQGLHESHEHITEYLEKNYKSATGRYDYYVLFAERGVTLLKKDGYFGFIIPHKFTSAQLGRGLRKYLAEKKLIHSFLNFTHNFVFKDSAVYTCILKLKNTENKKLLYHSIEDLGIKSLESLVAAITSKDFVALDYDKFSEKSWNFSHGTSSKILDKVKRFPNILEYFEKIPQGIVTGDNDLFILEPIKEKSSTMILFSKKAGEKIELEKEILKPLITGTDVKKYFQITKNRQFIIYPYTLEKEKQIIFEEDELKSKFPLAFEYLSKFKEQCITKKKKYGTNPKYWFSLHNSRNLFWFEQERIVTAQISLGCNMSIDNRNFLHNEQVYSFLKKKNTIIDNKYFLAILNSKIMWFFMKNTGVVLRGGYFRFKTKYLGAFHIPYPSKRVEKEIIEKVSMVLKFKEEYLEKYAKFLSRLQTTFGINNPSKKLKKFYELSFSSFLILIQKTTKKDNISLKEQDDWEEYFQLYKKQLLDLRNKYEKLEDQIDKMVYDIYELTNEEKQIVEKNYPKSNF